MANFPPYPYGGYQPMQMPQMQMPQMPPQMPQNGQMNQGGLSPMSRPVSSKEEAQACAADFVEFSPVETVAENATTPEYVCLQTYQEDMEKLRKELAGLKKVIISDE